MMSSFSFGLVGAGQFGRQFGKLFAAHPGVSGVRITDAIPERAQEVCDSSGAEFVESFDRLLESDVDAVGIFTQRWTHGQMAIRALRAGKHVFSAVPMAIDLAEIEEIVHLVRETGQTYMMAETSYYNPATVYVRRLVREGHLGEVFYAEGDYVHDMDLGFYDAYRYSGGDGWRETASFPPMLYPTHSIGGVLGALPRHAVSVSCIGVADPGLDGVFDRSVSAFDNDVSNAVALFELDNGGAMRTSEMRRVGYPAHLRESRFRFFGHERSFEQIATTSLLQDKHSATDVSALLETAPTMDLNDPRLAEVSESLRDAFVSGTAQVHQVARLPQEFHGLPNGHSGSHQFLVDDFVKAVNAGAHPAVNAWVAARFTAPGIVAHQSSRQNGERLAIPDHGDCPFPVRDEDAEVTT